VAVNLLGFHWLVYTISVFGGFSYALSGVIFLLFASLAAVQVALFGLLIRVCGLGPLNLFPAIFWVAIEFWFPNLFPWQLGNSQTPILTLIQTADVVGPYGTSFLVMWLNTTIYSALFSRDRRVQASLRSAAALGVLVITVLLYGHYRLSEIALEMEAAPKLTVAGVQGNIGVQMKWNPEQVKHNLDSYLDLTKETQGVELVIWPETAVEEWVPEEIRRLPPELLLSSNSTYFIFGARSFRGNLSGPNFEAFNSAFLADGRGRILGRYHKQALLAFGEYIPFASVLSRLPGIPPLGSFSEGEGPRTLDFSDGVRVGALICYEDLMPALSRRFVTEGRANLLVNLTNDAWYGRTVAPWQHARLAQWRAIETRRSLVRVTNTGVTMVINAKGEMVQALPIFTAGVLTQSVEIMEGKTLYSRFGDWFAWLLTLASVIVLLQQRKKVRNPQSQQRK
jgi:apolipoprotein N-acyltransferase